MGLRSTYASVLALATVAAAQKCPITLDGRIPAGSTPALFDTKDSPFGTEFVKGINLTFSKIIKIPDNTSTSLFDSTRKTEAFETTIDDLSIFAPSKDNRQSGFRRAELQFSPNTGQDKSTLGLKTLHFSIRKDPQRPLNLSHEYQFVFLEDAKFSTNQFVLKTGTIAGQPAGQDPNLLVLLGNLNAQPAVTLFKTPFTNGVNHNFGLTLDFDASKITVLYSTDLSPLKVVSGPSPNDLSGQGQYHFGVLKKPTGDNIKDVAKEGFQETGIDEGVIYGGLFMEDSTGGCVSLSAAGAGSAGDGSAGSSGDGSAGDGSAGAGSAGAAGPSKKGASKHHGPKNHTSKNGTKAAVDQCS